MSFHFFRNLSSYALESRQRPDYSSQFNNYYVPNRIPSSEKPYHHYAKPFPYEPVSPNRYYHRYPYPNVNSNHQYPGHPYRPNAPSFVPQRESVMDILHSVARNDDLQCVPKIICEVTSGTMGGRQTPIGLPLNVNLESLIG